MIILCNILHFNQQVSLKTNKSIGGHAALSIRDITSLLKTMVASDFGGLQSVFGCPLSRPCMTVAEIAALVDDTLHVCGGVCLICITEGNDFPERCHKHKER